MLLAGGIIVVATVCIASWRTSIKSRRKKAVKLAEELDMELLASDNPNSLVVAGEINNRASTIRYQKEPGNVLPKTENLLLSVECDCAIDFIVAKTHLELTPSDNHVSVAMLNSNALHLFSAEKEKTAYIFEQPETVQSLIDLFERTDADRLEVAAYKVNATVVETKEVRFTASRISDALQSLDRFARLLEFVLEEQSHSEN